MHNYSNLKALSKENDVRKMVKFKYLFTLRRLTTTLYAQDNLEASHLEQMLCNNAHLELLGVFIPNLFAFPPVL